MTTLQAIRQLSRKDNPIFILCTVISIDKSKQTAELQPINDGAPLLDCRLKPVIDEQEQGIIIYPAIQSVVIAAKLDNSDDYFVCSIANFESVLISITDIFKLELKADGTLELNGGTLGGLVNLHELVTEIQKLNRFLAAIKQTFTTWTPVLGDGGAALKIAMNVALATQQVADTSKLSNDKIKQ
jgi:hypothetical protein